MLTDYLAPRRLLLVLDKSEHVIDAIADWRMPGASSAGAQLWEAFRKLNARPQRGCRRV
jgi:predicted ATPase